MSSKLSWLIVLLVILSAAAVRIRLLDIPLERDEGEYAYSGQLILEGIPPYKVAWNMKLPGTYAAYAAVMTIFGQTIAGIHLGLLLVNAASVVLVYLLGKRFFGNVAGLVACASYALLSIGQAVLGTQAHATHFVVLAALAGTLLLLKADDSGRSSTVFWSGLLFGLAFLMKQNGAFFAAFGGVYLLWHRKPWRKLVLFVLGAVVPFGLTCLILWRVGVFAKFWFWTFSYARAYASELDVSQAPAMFVHMSSRVMHPNILLWLLAGLGLVLAFSKVNARRNAMFLAAFFAFSFFAICPGFYFRQHYFVLLLPAVALLAGVAISSAAELFKSGLPLLFFVGVFLYSVAGQSQFLFQMSPIQASRAMYSANPFPEAVELARYIREHSAKDAKIAVVGSEPEIFFYAQRHSATGYLYIYSMMESQPYALDMQREYIRDFETARPEYAVFVNVSGSWLVDALSENLLLDWWKISGVKHYKRVGFADIFRERTQYVWDAAAEHIARSPASSSSYSSEPTSKLSRRFC